MRSMMTAGYVRSNSTFSTQLVHSKKAIIWLLIKGSRVRVPPGSPVSVESNGVSDSSGQLNPPSRFFDIADFVHLNSINSPGSSDAARTWAASEGKAPESRFAACVCAGIGETGSDPMAAVGYKDRCAVPAALTRADFPGFKASRGSQHGGPA